MKYRIFLILCVAVLLSSFKTSQSPDLTQLEGIWIYKSFGNEIHTCQKVRKFPKDEGGYKFEKNGVLKVKQNSGWCGTLPISYETVKGKWEKVNDSVIHTEYPYWGGHIEQNFHIISLNRSELTYRPELNYKK